MKGKQFIALFVLVTLLSVFVTGCSGVSRIDSFFTNGEFKQHAKIIDFSLFFVMFFALCYLGLSKVWGEGFGKPGGSAKGSIVALSLALALAFAFAIVTQTSFSITTIFPVAKAIFFLIIWFLLWGLLVMSKIFGDHWGGKFIAAVLALLAAYIIFSIGTHMICQMSDNMSDPACKSDFFNAMFTILGRWFGIDSWTSTGKTGQGGGTQTVPATPISSLPPGDGKPATSQGGDIEGGCRLDITFDFNSPTALTSSAPVSEYVTRAKALKKTSIHVYGFASTEGQERYNFGLAGSRGRTISNMVSGADSSMSTSISSRGPVSYFDSTNLAPNRRVVLSTESISNFANSPSPGSIHNCPEAGQSICGDGVKNGAEQCDGNDDAACAKKCQKNCTCPVAAVPPVVPTGSCDPKKTPTGCKPGETCTPDGKCIPAGANAGNTTAAGKSGSGGWWSWWYLLLLPLIPLLFFLFTRGYNWVHARRTGMNPDELNDELLALIRLARQHLVSIRYNIQRVPWDDARDRPLFRRAIQMPHRIGLMARVRNNLGANPVYPTIPPNPGLVFMPGLTPEQRNQLITDVYECARVVHRARNILEDSVLHHFWPRVMRMRRLRNRFRTRVAVSPLLHTSPTGNNNITFIHDSPAPVELRIRSAPIGTAGAFQTFPMQQMQGIERWWYRAPPPNLRNGVYRYIYIVGGARVWDPRNLNRTSDNPAPANNDWNLAVVANIEAEAGRIGVPH